MFGSLDHIFSFGRDKLCNPFVYASISICKMFGLSQQLKNTEKLTIRRKNLQLRTKRKELAGVLPLHTSGFRSFFLSMSK